MNKKTPAIPKYMMKKHIWSNYPNRRNPNLPIFGCCGTSTKIAPLLIFVTNLICIEQNYDKFQSGCILTILSKAMNLHWKQISLYYQTLGRRQGNQIVMWLHKLITLGWQGKCQYDKEYLVYNEKKNATYFFIIYIERLLCIYSSINLQN